MVISFLSFVNHSSLFHVFSSIQEADMEFTKTISTQEIRKHNTPEDCWIVIDDQVWDVTNFAPEHPGGSNRTYTQQYPEPPLNYLPSHPKVCRPRRNNRLHRIPQPFPGKGHPPPRLLQGQSRPLNHRCGLETRCGGEQCHASRSRKREAASRQHYQRVRLAPLLGVVV